MAEVTPFGHYNRYLWATMRQPLSVLKMLRSTAPELSFSDADRTDQHLDLCHRIIRAYQLATAQTSTESLGPVWGGLPARVQTFAHQLTSGDAPAVAEYLAKMFRREVLHGISSANLWTTASSSFGRRIWFARFSDELQALAQAIGASRSCTPGEQQHEFGDPTQLDPLAAKVEKTLGIPLEFPEVGGAYGYRAGPRLLTMETPEHVYVAWRIRESMKLPAHGSPNRVAEIGAGFGGLAYWLIQLVRSDIERYTIIDLPIVNVVQTYFLARVFGAQNVSCYGEPDAWIRVLPAIALEHVGIVDVLVNENSMPEIPREISIRYLEWVKRNVRKFFYSYNHEAVSLYGVPHVPVPALLQEVGGFERLSRNNSWLRRGYVEEVYAISPPTKLG